MIYNLGKVVITPRGEYDTNESYDKLDMVTYNGSSYVAKESTLGNLPTDTKYWQLMSSAATITFRQWENN